MSPLLQLLLLTTLAGLAIPAGGLLAAIEKIHPNWLEDEFRHSVLAFGGGVLLAAVALVLVPEGVQHLTVPLTALAVAAGGIAFMAFDRVLAASRSSAAQLVAMLLDFVPESLAMGAAFANGNSVGLLLALLIAVQNLPEGFNAYRELVASSGMTRRKVLVGFLLLVPLGPLSGLGGYLLLADHPQVLGGIMLFASGGILYLIFQDIAPAARLEQRQLPALGAVFGFLFGLVGQMLLV